MEHVNNKGRRRGRGQEETLPAAHALQPTGIPLYTCSQGFCRIYVGFL